MKYNMHKNKFLNFYYNDEVEYDYSNLNFDKNVFFLNNYKKLQMFNNDLLNVSILFSNIYNLILHLFFIRILNYYRILIYFVIFSIK